MIRRLIVYGISAVLVIGALFTAVAVMGRGGLGGMIPARCTVGLAGAAVSITADGPGAETSCQGWAGQVTDGGTWYEYSNGEQPGGAIICQGKIGDVTVTVRDQGSLNAHVPHRFDESRPGDQMTGRRPVMAGRRPVRGSFGPVLRRELLQEPWARSVGSFGEEGRSLGRIAEHVADP